MSCVLGSWGDWKLVGVIEWYHHSRCQWEQHVVRFGGVEVDGYLVVCHETSGPKRRMAQECLGVGVCVKSE